MKPFNLFLLFSLFLSAESYEDEVNALEQSSILNRAERNNLYFTISDLKSEIENDTELMICNYNFLADVNKLEYKFNPSLIKSLERKINSCRNTIGKYRQNILYYKNLTRNIHYQNANAIRFSDNDFNRMLNGRLSSKDCSLATMKYNLDTSTIVQSILRANNNQMAIDSILDGMFLKYKSHIKNEKRNSYYRDEKNNVTIIDKGSTKNSIMINSTDGVEF
jgi:hypothetical protein